MNLFYESEHSDESEHAEHLFAQFRYKNHKVNIITIDLNFPKLAVTPTNLRPILRTKEKLSYIRIEAKSP